MSLYCDVYPDFFSERVSVSRQEYRCCECGFKINKGQKYWYCVGKWEGDVSSYKQHIECRDACYKIQKHQGECIPFGGLREWLSDYGKTWEEDAETNKLKIKTPIEIEVRNLLAAGIKASRVKGFNLINYNSKHGGRTP